MSINLIASHEEAGHEFTDKLRIVRIKLNEYRTVTSKRIETIVTDIVLRRRHEGAGTRAADKFTRVFTSNALICRVPLQFC